MTTIDNSPAEVDIVFTQGDDWIKAFRLGSRPDPDSDIEYWDLTGYEASSQVRKKPSGPVLATLTVDIGPNQTVPETAGYITARLNASASAGLPSACVWDLQLVDPGGVKRTYFAGTVTVVREVTKD